jgi:hypothetical protein
MCPILLGSCTNSTPIKSLKFTENDCGDYATKADAIAAMGRVIKPEVTYYNEKGEEIV